MTQRGNNRQDVFFVDDDRREYLRILREQAKRFGVAIEAYCLMTNHVHLVATPATTDGLAKAVGFISKFETLFGRRLRALPLGRPKRKRTK